MKLRCCVAALLLGLAPRGGAAEPLGIESTAAWNPPQGAGQLQTVAPPVARPTGPAQALKLTAEKGAFVYTRSGRLPADLAQAESLSFWVYRAPTEQSGSSNHPVLEVQFLEADGKAKFWRRVDITASGWSRQNVPLRYLAWSPQRSPRWDNVRHLGLYARTPATLWIDSLEIERCAGTNAVLAADELAGLAFPSGAVRRLEQAEGVILSDAADLDLELLGRRLAAFVQTARRELPFLGQPVSPPLLLVFAHEPDYRGFTPRFAQRLHQTGAAPTSGGYTIQALATSFWDPAQGSARPVYVHEYAHAWLDRVAALPAGRGDWLQEGFANHHQLLLHPQANFGQLVRTGLASPDAHLPLEQLCSGQRVPLNRYWQAATVLRFLLATRSDKLPALFAAFSKAGSTDLGPQLGPVLETNWEDFSAAWRAFCHQAHP